jgi:hypothetical protein
MPKYRNIRVKSKGGKVRIQRAMVLASGKLRFVKNTSRPRKASKSKRRADKRTKGSVRGKKDYVFTAARRRAAVRNLKHGRSKRRRSSPRRRTSHRRRRSRSRKGIRRRSRSGGIGLG